MSGRISIRGKGNTLFFESDDAAASRPDRPMPKTARQTDSGPARQTASKPPSKTDSQTERQTARQTASEASGDSVAPLREALLEPHPIHNTFRYSQSDLDALRDIVYELEVKRNLKTTRNEVMRLGLAYIMDDYGANGADSLLVRVLLEVRGRGVR